MKMLRNILLITLLPLMTYCASTSETPIMDDYNEIKSEYLSIVQGCKLYFGEMKSLYKEEEDITDNPDNNYKLTQNKKKILKFIRNYRYPLDEVRVSNQYHSFIYDDSVQDSEEFSAIHRDYSITTDLNGAESCEDSFSVLNFYRAMIPTLREKGYWRDIQRQYILNSIKSYLYSRRYLKNEPLISPINDLNILAILSQNKLLQVKKDQILSYVDKFEEIESKLQSEYNSALGLDIIEKYSEEALSEVTSEEEDNESEIEDPTGANFNTADKIHTAETKESRKARKIVNKLIAKITW